MTVSTTTYRADYTGNGVTTAFTIPFYFTDATHIVVYRTQISTGAVSTLALTTDYTVAGAGVAGGGTLTLLAAPTSDQKIAVLRNVPYTQSTHYVPNDPFPAATHEAGLDLAAMRDQQLQEQVNRSMLLPPSVSGVSATLPVPAANQVVAWNNTGTALQNVDVNTLATVVSYGTAKSDIFTGDGTTKTFTLSSNPGAQANLDVDLGGVTQTAGIDFNWTSGTALTFAVAPPNGVRIHVRYMQALAQGTIDWASITSKPFVSVKDFGAVGDGVTDDSSAFQATVNAAPDYAVVEIPPGTYKITSTITLKPKLTIRCRGLINFTASGSDLFSYTPGTPTGWPGQIVIDGIKATGPGNTGTCTAVKIDANAPFVTIRNCYFSGFFGGIYLRDCYGSVIDQCEIFTVSHGIRLVRESHAVTVRDTLVDSATVACLSINYGGGAGTGPTHNVNVIGGALQNSAVGLWAENSLELHTVGIYHEGNSVNDYVIGVADAGAYARACYNVVIDGFNSSSPCASGKNVKIEHSVGVQIRSAAWNSGCSTTASLLSYDGYCDRIVVDVSRYTTTTPTATAPVDFTADATRGVLYYRGRAIFGAGQTDSVQFGNLASILGALYQGFVPVSGRNALTLQSKSQDLQIRAPELIRLQDNAGTDYMQIDALNGRVSVAKPLYLSAQTTGTTVGAAGAASALPATPLGYLTLNLNGVNVRIPYYN